MYRESIAGCASQRQKKLVTKVTSEKNCEKSEALGCCATACGARKKTAVIKAKGHLDDFFFARGERTQHLRGLVLEVHVDHGLSRRDHGAILDEVAQVRIFFFTNGGFQRDGLLRDLKHLADFRH